MAKTISAKEQLELDELLSNCMSELEHHGPTSKGPRTVQQPKNGYFSLKPNYMSKLNPVSYGDLSARPKVTQTIVEVHECDRSDSGLSMHEYQTISRDISPTQSVSTESAIYAKISKSTGPKEANGGRTSPSTVSESSSNCEPLYSTVRRAATTSPRPLNSSASTESQLAKLDDAVLNLMKEIETLPDHDEAKFQRSSSMRFDSKCPPKRPVRSSSFAVARTVQFPTANWSTGSTSSYASREPCSQSSFRVGPPVFASTPVPSLNSSNLSDTSSVFESESPYGEPIKNLSWLERQKMKLKAKKVRESHRKELERKNLEQRLVDELRGSFRSFRMRDNSYERTVQVRETYSYSNYSLDRDQFSSFRTPLYVQTGHSNFDRRMRGVSEPSTPILKPGHRFV
ncbi:hypothetical protein HDE_11589 [Halotydeus destructor]|nr:hypothetical protein HDE_11589 [Halotydeus destructor]